MANNYRIAVLVGSLRRDSFNRKLANALAKMAPPEFSSSRCKSTTCRSTTRTTTPASRLGQAAQRGNRSRPRGCCS